MKAMWLKVDKFQFNKLRKDLIQTNASRLLFLKRGQHTPCGSVVASWLVRSPLGGVV